MSLPAYLRAVRDHLRLTQSWDEEVCRVRIDGKPTPDCGQFFVAIHPSRLGPLDTDLNLGIDEMLDIDVTVTVRTGDRPFDLLGEDELLDAYDGLYAYANIIKNSIHQSYYILSLANTHLSSVTNNPNNFIEPLRWSGTDCPPTVRDASWFTAAITDESNEYGLSVAVHFRDARRPQTLDNLQTEII